MFQQNINNEYELGRCRTTVRTRRSVYGSGNISLFLWRVGYGKKRSKILVEDRNDFVNLTNMVMRLGFGRLWDRSCVSITFRSPLERQATTDSQGVT